MKKEMIFIFLGICFYMFLFPYCVNAEEINVMVDGLTGAASSNFKLVRPGDSITVSIKNADVIRYVYEIKLEDRGLLKMDYPVVYVDTVGVLQEMQKKEAVGLFESEAVKNFDYEEVKKEDLLNKIVENYLSLKRTFIKLSFYNENDIKKEILKLGLNKSELESKINKIREKNESAEEELKQLSSKLELLNSEYGRFAIKKKIDEMNSKKIDKEFKNFDDWFFPKLTETLGNIRTTLSFFAGYYDICSRIEYRLKQFPEFSITRNFTIDRLSKKYELIILRKEIDLFAQAVPIVQGSAAEGGEQSATPADGGKTSKAEKKKEQDLPVLCSVAFECHAYYRVNFSLGMVGFSRKGKGTYQIVSQLNENDEVEAFVKKLDQDDLSVSTMFAIGVYLGRNGLDLFAPKTKPQMMVIVGAEIKKLNNFLLGLGLDTGIGIIISAGFTNYKKTTLADGWQENQKIPLNKDDVPILKDLPIKNKTTIGYFFSISFCPKIFDLFKSLI